MPSNRQIATTVRVVTLAAIAVYTTWIPSGAMAAERIRIRVAGAQMSVARDVSQNVETLTRAIEYAAREKADVLVTPEGSLSGYTPGFDAEAAQRGIEVVLQRARAARLGLVLGTCFEAKDGRRYNAQQFYDQEGRYLGFHAKILLCRRMAMPEAKAEVDSFQTRPLRTFNLSGLTVGGLICNDLWAHPEWTPMDDPHLSQKLADMGARMIFVSANTGQSTGDYLIVDRAYHDANLRLRARAGKIWIVVANAAPVAPRERPSPSGVVAPDGSWALSVPLQGEHFFVHTIEFGPPAPASSDR